MTAYELCAWLWRKQGFVGRDQKPFTWTQICYLVTRKVKEGHGMFYVQEGPFIRGVVVYRQEKDGWYWIEQICSEGKDWMKRLYEKVQDIPDFKGLRGYLVSKGRYFTYDKDFLNRMLRV